MRFRYTYVFRNENGENGRLLPADRPRADR